VSKLSSATKRRLSSDKHSCVRLPRRQRMKSEFSWMSSHAQHYINWIAGREKTFLTFLHIVLVVVCFVVILIRLLTPALSSFGEEREILFLFR